MNAIQFLCFVFFWSCSYMYNFSLLSLNNGESHATISLSTAGVTLSFSIYIYLLLQKVHLIYVSTIAQKEGKTFPKTFTADQSVQKCGCCSSSCCKREQLCCNNISKFCNKKKQLCCDNISAGLKCYEVTKSAADHERSARSLNA